MFNKWVTGVVFLLVGVFLVGAANLHGLVNRLEQKLSVVVFFKPGLPANRVAAAVEKIKMLSNVDDVTAVTPDKALADFTQDPTIAQQIQVVGENPLPASLIIKVKDTDLQWVRPLVARITEMEGIDEIKYGEQEAARIQVLVQQINLARNLIAALSGLVCLLLLAYVYSFGLLAAGATDKDRMYRESLFIYLGSLAAAFILLWCGYRLVLKPLNHFVFFTARGTALFAAVTLVLQACGLQLALLHPKIRAKM